MDHSEECNSGLRAIMTDKGLLRGDHPWHQCGSGDDHQASSLLHRSRSVSSVSVYRVMITPFFHSAHVEMGNLAIHSCRLPYD